MAPNRIPPKADPRWKMLVTSDTKYPLKGLATQMVITRVRLISFRKDPKAVQEAIDVAYDYFSRNLEAATEDIRTIFGA